MVWARLQPRTVAALDEQARRSGIERGTVIREALEQATGTAPVEGGTAMRTILVFVFVAFGVLLSGCVAEGLPVEEVQDTDPVVEPSPDLGTRCVRESDDVLCAGAVCGAHIRWSPRCQVLFRVVCGSCEEGTTCINGRCEP